jgi:GH24 family phage-related lysozyme (muramidase)
MPKVTIQSGNTLTGIAKGTGYTPAQLAAYNDIEDPNKIRVGQDIFIPYSRQEFESFAGPMEQPVQATAPVQPVAPPQPVVQTSQAEIVDPDLFSNRLISFLKEQEGEALTEYLDLGKPAIGYGHNLTEDEIAKEEVYGHDVSKPISKAAAEDILRRDLENFTTTLDSKLFSKHGVRLSELPEKSREMLLDLEFNLGNAVGEFPTFTKALVNGDIETAKKEYERGYYENKNTPDEKFVPLTRRNTGFFNTFLN